MALGLYGLFLSFLGFALRVSGFFARRSSFSKSK